MNYTSVCIANLDSTLTPAPASVLLDGGSGEEDRGREITACRPDGNGDPVPCRPDNCTPSCQPSACDPYSEDRLDAWDGSALGDKAGGRSGAS
jgi:hypothetical protein